MPSTRWQFFIDVGGTFTDVIARTPDGSLLTHKLLSSGVVRGVVDAGSTSTCIVDPRRARDPDHFWDGCKITLTSTETFQPREDSHATPEPHAEQCELRDSTRSARVTRFDATTGRLSLDGPLGPHEPGQTLYELSGEDEAPVLAIRYLMGLGHGDPIGAVEVRLGTTRATNALLERSGANVAFVTTKGFADALRIGYQDRPHLFELNIQKRSELASQVIEIDERLDGKGNVLHAPRRSEVRRSLEEAKAVGVEALAICLLHGYANPVHEEVVASIADSVGFAQISVSSQVARLEKLVPRGDTTVVDAYVSGVIRGYVASLARSMPEARLWLMTSHGGLVRASAASGKDTILSGPAGGVLGCRHVARRAGIERTIGFDMGGTSTDVSRIDEPPHELEYQHETVKAGVRIMTPMLAVETVAAGGGSICDFDGQKLIVGPKSAGADPGPACYGRNGPLTVTDMNVLLGRVVPEFFPFRLHRDVAGRKLSDLCDRVNAQTGSKLEPASMAEGFIRIANANMAAAIKRISMAKGYDVRDYALTTFGGAGAQHACAIARTLGMSRVLCSPYAGVLSALGIGVADVKRISQRSVCEPLDERTSARLESVFEAVEHELGEDIRRDGIDTGSLSPPVRTMDMCYVGQATLVTVPAERNDLIDLARERFEDLHRRLYGYVHEDRAVEIRVLRSELSAAGIHLDIRPTATDDAPPDATSDAPSVVPRTTEMFVDGEFRVVPLHVRRELSTERRMTGPAIIIEDTSTIVVEPGWDAAVLESGDILLTDRAIVPDREPNSTDADPIRLELFNNRLAAVAEQMGTTLKRTALSVNVKERFDFSCAVFTPTGDLVVNAPHIPVHLGGMSDCVKALMADVGDFLPGDVYITNDPYRGGSHLNDVTVITPIHDQSGRRIEFFVASRAHHAEIGGTRPGSMPPDSTSLAQEGVVIRAFRWIVDGRAQREGLRALLTKPPYPSRTPDENLADVAAQAAANQTGVRELRAMMDRYGVEVVHAYTRHIQTAAESKMRRALERLPDGVHRFADTLDDGSPIELTVTISGDSATIDFTGTGDVLPGNLNANRAIVTSAVLYCLRCLIDEDIPLNAGVLAPVNLILPECFLNPPGSDDPARCPAVVGGNVETSQRIVDCIFGALKTAAASQGTMNNLLVGNAQFGYYETICGGAGAGPGFDGADAVHTHMTNTRMTDPEVLESRVPVRLVRFTIRRGSGGRGQFRGGCGVIRELEFLDRLDVSIISQRRTTAPYGLSGGEDGQCGRNVLRRADSEQDELLPPIARVAVKPGDRLTLETPGGGGWGPHSWSEHSRGNER